MTSQAPTESHHDFDGALCYQLRLPLQDTNRYLDCCRKNAMSSKGRVSSAVEQRFCKPLVGSSILSPGTNKIRYFLRYYPWKYRCIAISVAKSQEDVAPDNERGPFCEAKLRSAPLRLRRFRGFRQWNCLSRKWKSLIVWRCATDLHATWNCARQKQAISTGFWTDAPCLPRIVSCIIALPASRMAWPLIFEPKE